MQTTQWTQRWRTPRAPWTARRVGLGLVLAGALASAPTAPAALAQTTTTIAYTCTGFPQPLSVPPGVTQLTATAVGGAEGGDMRNGGQRGPVVTGAPTVTPGHLLTLDVGCQGGTFGDPRSSSGVRQVAVGADGSVWVVTKDAVDSSGNYQVAFFDQRANAWPRVDGGAARIAAGPAGQPWVLTAAGPVWQRSRGATTYVDGRWQQVPNIGAVDTAVGTS